MYKIDLTIHPSLCLPEYIDMTELIEITAMGEIFSVYLDNKTGKIYDGNKYYSDYLKQIEI